MLIEILKSPSFLSAVLTVCCTLVLFIVKEIIDITSCYFAIMTELKVLKEIFETTFLKEIDNHRDVLSESAIEFLNELLEKNSTENILTETGRKILISMYTNKETYLNTFSSKQLGELLFMSARSISGSMRKLVTEQYVEKAGTNPVTYKLTKNGEALAEELQIDKK